MGEEVLTEHLEDVGGSPGALGSSHGMGTIYREDCV